MSFQTSLAIDQSILQCFTSRLLVLCLPRFWQIRRITKKHIICHTSSCLYWLVPFGSLTQHEFRHYTNTPEVNPVRILYLELGKRINPSFKLRTFPLVQNGFIVAILTVRYFDAQCYK
ncbi:hypothetical protein O181_040926 [Austropuccinia psidii MF-1]|uniref:Uncharacterized protein n=1 Tax=Austropuccinia psidii MF-1 TaxID=1389203 RepID=A0A9Q3DC87_9BASI|nr:hypothetical protein [Austropuccinia psidii MF-1]